MRPPGADCLRRSRRGENDLFCFDSPDRDHLSFTEANIAPRDWIASACLSRRSLVMQVLETVWRGEPTS
jgi:hypothetical protein